ncbi:MAG: hypothetical protein R3B95_11520 [Nitrospirales bacterium]|nr:hypothetical protein [Nitrospirales bacterium]
MRTKFLGALISSSVVMMLMGSLALAQTEPVVCGPGMGLEWNANVEPDMQKYLVYAAPQATQVYTLVATVPHDPSQIVTRPDGSQAIEGGLAQVPDGLTEFYVTAVDTSENESQPSEHLVCDVQLPPIPPSGLKVTIQLANP